MVLLRIAKYLHGVFKAPIAGGSLTGYVFIWVYTGGALTGLFASSFTETPSPARCAVSLVVLFMLPFVVDQIKRLLPGEPPRGQF